MRKRGLIGAAAAVLTMAGAAVGGTPQYAIIDLGLIHPGDVASQGLGISPGGVGVGRGLGSPSQAFSWTLGGGMTALPNLASPSRPFGVANGANDSGAVVGTGTTNDGFGSSPLPLLWQGGVVSQLPLPAGQTLGRANDINGLNMAVGSVGSGSSEVASIYFGGVGTTITQAAVDGSTMRTAFRINDAGLIVGFGVDPNNAARNVGFVYDSSMGISYEVGALPGRNGAICFDVSEAGHIVGSSMMNQGSGVPFIWTSGGGMTEIPMPWGASSGSARGVNSGGWAVGNSSTAFSVPWLYDGAQSYRLQDLIPGGSGWDLSMNTSNSALGISEDGTIIGTAVINGATHAYAMVLVPTPGAVTLLGVAGLASVRRRRR